MKKNLLNLILFVPFIVTAQSYDINGDHKISGKVGIGTSSPAAKLSIVGSATALELDTEPSGSSILSYNRSSSVFKPLVLRGSDFNFMVNDQGKFFINNAGNVGIGTPIPDWKLHIKGALAVEGDGAANYADLNLKNGNVRWHISGPRYGENNRLGIFWHDGNTYYDHFTIGTNGNVGIGTNQPQTKLEVTGSGVDPNVLKLSSFDVQTNTISMVFHPRGNYLPNPASSIKGILDYGIANQEAGSLSFNTSNSGQLSERMRIRYDGNVGIGTATPDSKLTVAGNIHSREVKVTVNAGADFVFQDGYDLRTLKEVEQFIIANKHLPDIQPAKDMEEKGLELGKMDMKLLQKIEELTLYMIDIKKEMDKIKEENQKLKDRLIELNKN